MLSLAGAPLTVTLGARAQSGRGAVVFSRKGSAAVALDLFDLAGRRLATLAPEAVADGVRWSWDGRDESGRRVGPAWSSPARATAAPARA